MKRLLINLLLTGIISATGLAKSDTIPSFINTASNRIDLNQADWTPLKHKLQNRLNGDTSTIRVLHIGDSHIQAEFVTNELRRLLQEHYGNAGRGLLMPLRLAGTNQSHDYSVTSTQPVDFTQTRLLKLPWPVKPGVTGIAAQPAAKTSLTWRTTIPGHNIKNAVLLSDKGVTTVPTGNSDSIITDIEAGQTVYGLLTDNGQPGILYSAIGNNGACFNDYLLIDRFAEKTQMFNPDLIILSMGTNEAFSYMTDKEIERSVKDLVRLLHHYNPDAEFLILTPMECQKNRNHGFRPLSEFYDINLRNAEVARIIKDTATQINIPVWDFYAVAGGDGTSGKWLDAGLMNKDRIHLLKPGYELQARLLYDALMDVLP